MLLDEKNITRIYMDLLIEFARTGIGIGCVIREFVQEDLRSGQLLLLPLTFPIPKREVGFSYLKNRDLPIHVQKFIEFISITR